MIRCPTCGKWFQSLGYARHRAMHYDRKMAEPCFACGQPMKENRAKADTRDGQIVFVGRDCLAHVEAAGDAGYQPPKGGPRLYPMRAPEPQEKETR